MKTRLIIQIPSKKRMVVFMQILYIHFMLWIRDILGLPFAITYLTDILTIYMIVFHFFSIKKGFLKRDLRPQRNIAISILICMILGTMINLVNPLLVLWGLRNSFRFFIFFFICVGILTKKDIIKFVEFFKIFFLMNTLMITYQFFIQGYRDDLLGGFFGVSAGCNAYVCVMLCVITTIVFAEFNYSKMSPIKLVGYCIICMYIATLCELKIYFVEFIIIAFIQSIYTRPSKKTIGIYIAAFVGLIIGFNLISRYNPEILKIFLYKDAMDYYLSGNGYTNSGDLNRLTAIQELYSKFFKGDIIHTLFGFGLGNCEQSSFSFLQSAFYNQYSYLYYRWFSHAWIFLEQGAIGLVLTGAFFLSIALSILKNRKKIKEVYDLAVFSFIPTCLIGLIYNCALELEVSYLIALICAFPFIARKNDK